MTDEYNKKLEYPVVDHDSKSKKDFIQKMQTAMDAQLNNPTEVQKAAFYNQDASGKKIYKIQLSDQLFKGCKFYTAKIISSKFKACTFIDCDFSASDILNVKFEECTFRGCNFTDAKMQDVTATDCSKVNCIFANVQFTNNVQGFEINQENIIQDSVQAQKNQQSQNVNVYQAVKKALSDWKQVQHMSFELFGKDQNCGLAIYPNSQKNSDQTEDIWQFVFFYGDQSVLMNDFNLYGMSAQQIKALVDRWKNQDLIEQSQTIIKNVLQIIQEKRK